MDVSVPFCLPLQEQNFSPSPFADSPAETGHPVYYKSTTYAFHPAFFISASNFIHQIGFLRTASSSESSLPRRERQNESRVYPVRRPRRVSRDRDRQDGKCGVQQRFRFHAASFRNLLQDMAFLRPGNVS
jgi:hypothetical protein